MGFKCGIIGLPNVGKSTLFNALTETASAEAANYPFCTIEPNSGAVELFFKVQARDSFGPTVKKVIKNNNCDFYILFNPTGLSWLLNIRGRDLKHTPISRSFCIVSKKKELHIFTKNISFKNSIKKVKDIHICNFEYLSHFLENSKNKNFLTRLGFSF